MAKKMEFIKEILLTNGQTVKINTNLSLAAVKVARLEGLMSEDIIRDMMMIEVDPTQANFEDLENAPFLAYRNANPDGMEQEEFEEHLPFDLEMYGQIYGQIVANEARKKQMAEEFKKVTNGKKNKSKKNARK